MISFCWSYTAPSVTQEQVEAEKAALTEEEQQQIQDDLYGAYDPIEETPQIIADKIDEMREYINTIEDEDKESYLVAQEKCADYCNSEEFQLMFLRADKLDAKKAASRLVSYWEDKLKIFGPDRTYHRISLNDLLAFPGDIELLKSGAIYPLPNKDKAGRAILFFDRSKLAQLGYDRRNKLRLFFYMLHCLFEDDAVTQKKGFVLFSAPPDDIHRRFDRKMAKHGWNALRGSLPVRLAAYHLTVPAGSFISMIFLPILFYLMGQDLRNRLVVHRFRLTPWETSMNIEDYGIKKDFLPKELGGTVNFDYDGWLEKRRTIEEAR